MKCLTYVRPFEPKREAKIIALYINKVVHYKLQSVGSDDNETTLLLFGYLCFTLLISQDETQDI